MSEMKSTQMYKIISREDYLLEGKRKVTWDFERIIIYMSFELRLLCIAKIEWVFIVNLWQACQIVPLPLLEKGVFW